MKKLLVGTALTAGLLLGGVGQPSAEASTISNLGNTGINGINQIDLQNMDLETALMLVQSQRTKLLDAQLQDQIAEVQKKNETLSKLNEIMNNLNTMNSKIYSWDESKGAIPNLKSEQEIIKPIYENLGLIKFELNMSTEMKKDNIKKQIENEIATIKSRIDNLSNAQQMDMLRLQSLNNKRNEAFDTMTQFVKKMQDSRSSIIGNMR